MVCRQAWTELKTAGPKPPARCSHAMACIDRRVVVFGGQGTSSALLSPGGCSDPHSCEGCRGLPQGPEQFALEEDREPSDVLCAGLLGDLWSLKGASGGSVAASWTSLDLPGTWPCPRRNHVLAGEVWQRWLPGASSTCTQKHACWPASATPAAAAVAPWQQSLASQAPSSEQRLRGCWPTSAPCCHVKPRAEACTEACNMPAAALAKAGPRPATPDVHAAMYERGW